MNPRLPPVALAILVTLVMTGPASLPATAAPGGGGGGDMPYDPCPPKSRYAPPYADTDGDGLSDCVEVNIHGTDPRDARTDGDWLTDGEEVLVYGTDPLSADTDGDGLGNDYVEVTFYGTDPLVADIDSDGDGYSDAMEANHGLDPANPDTDGDGLDDATDTICPGTPAGGKGYSSYGKALSTDFDGDGLGDLYEKTVSKTSGCLADFDQDGFSDAEEVQAGTNPSDPQSFP